MKCKICQKEMCITDSDCFGFREYSCECGTTFTILGENFDGEWGFDDTQCNGVCKECNYKSSCKDCIGEY